MKGGLKMEGGLEMAVEMLVKAILEDQLKYYQATGSYAYVAQYKDGELKIVYNSLSAKEARPEVEFEIIASARWEDNLGNPAWTIYDGDGEAVAAIATDIDGTVIEDDVYYYMR